jgi:amino acid permease
MATSLLPQPNAPADPPPLTPEQIAARKAQERQTRVVIISISATAVLVLALLITAIYFLLRPETPADMVGKIRDVFIIVVGLETLIIGSALVILLIQLASLINLLQNEVRPILQATNETVNTLRGTAEFLGENLVEPVIKLNSYLASIQRVLELMGLKHK